MMTINPQSHLFKSSETFVEVSCIVSALFSNDHTKKFGGIKSGDLGGQILRLIKLSSWNCLIYAIILNAVCVVTPFCCE